MSDAAEATNTTNSAGAGATEGTAWKEKPYLKY